MMLAILALAGHASMWSCVGSGEFITSELSVQVFVRNEPVPAKVTVKSRGRLVAEAEADVDGHLRVASVTPGRYGVRVELTGFGSFDQNVTISRSAQKRMLVVGLTIPGPGQCPSWCYVPTAAGPLRDAPKCLQ